MREAKPAYALAALFVLCYAVGKLHPFWPLIVAVVLVTAMVTWVVAVVRDLRRPPPANPTR